MWCTLNWCYLWLLWFSSKCLECLLRDYQLGGSKAFPRELATNGSSINTRLWKKNSILWLLGELALFISHKKVAQVITIRPALVNSSGHVVFLNVDKMSHQQRIKFKLLNLYSMSSTAFFLFFYYLPTKTSILTKQPNSLLHKLFIFSLVCFCRPHLQYLPYFPSFPFLSLYLSPEYPLRGSMRTAS